MSKEAASKRSFRRTQGPQSGRGVVVTGGRKHADSMDEGNEVCLICAEKLKYVALSPCNHTTCHRCAFRQRALYSKKACLVCRTENEQLIFTNDIASQYADHEKDQFFSQDSKYGINFTSAGVADATLALLKYTCPLCEQSTADYGSYKKYNEHLKSEHNRHICMICATNKHAFPRELKTYSPTQLKTHQSRGDFKGFKGHPMCGFCSGRRFYSDDELFLHMRSQHEKCHICDKLDPSSPQYFKDYEQLFEHFKNYHYTCTVQSCIDDKFVVFADELELQAHILQEHGNILRGKPKLFQSELSTFISSPAQVIRESNTIDYPTLSDSSTSLSSMRSENDTPELRRLRLEERAKHYLENSQELYESFLELNKKYTHNAIDVQELVTSYQSLFTSPHANIYLLIHNLADTFPQNSNKYKELNVIYQAEESKQAKKLNLPSLSGSSSVPTVSGFWGGSKNGSKSKKTSRTLGLPSLQPKSPSHDVFAATTSKPHTYKSLSAPRNGSRTSVVNTVRSEVPPSYLQNKPSRPSPTVSPSPSNVVLTGTNNQGRISTADLPSLPTPKPRVYIPPVNKTVLPDPKKWGKQNANNLQDSLETLNISSISPSENKKNGKQKQLLFHIGV